MGALLEFRDVSYEISGRTILRGIRLAVDEGETLVLLGRSGSGKTTLLRTVNALIRPTGGDVYFEEHSVAARDPISLRRRIGYVIQESGLFPHMTVEQNIGLIPRLEQWPEERIHARTLELLAAMHLPAEYAGRRPRQLSGGEKQRVGIARALAADPPLLLLDEPFAALDPVTRFELQRQFIELRRTFRKTSVFVTHDIREALLVGSRIALLRNGELDTLGTPREFLHAQSEEAKTFLNTLTNDGRTDELPVRG